MNKLEGTNGKKREAQYLTGHKKNYKKEFPWSIQAIRNLTYKDRLKHLNLHSLERHRARGGMIEVFKWVKGFNKGDINKVLIVKKKVRTLTNGLKLDKFR